MMDLNKIQEFDLVMSKETNITTSEDKDVTLKSWDHLVIVPSVYGLQAFIYNQEIGRRKCIDRSLPAHVINNLYNGDYTYRRFLITNLDGSKNYIMLDKMEVSI